MNIVHINLFDEYGGAAGIANAIAASSRAAGHRVHTFAHKATSGDETVIPIPFLEQQCFQDLMQKQQEKRLMDYYSNAILRVLVHPLFRQADIVHLHCIYSGFFSYLLLPFLAVKPLVWTFHDTSVFTAHCVYPHRCDHWQTAYCAECPLDKNEPVKWNREFDQHFKENIFRITPFTIVAPSQWMKGLVEQSILRSSDIRLIYNGIDTDLYRPGNKVQLRQQLGLPQDKKIIMFAAHGGLTNEMKGGKYLFSALKQLQNQQKNCFFLHIGAPPGIALPGLTMPMMNIPYVADSRIMAKYYAASDVFVSTSLTESFGLTVCESMACGTPVVAFATGGVTELIEHNKTGILVQTGDVKGLVNGLVKVLNDSEFLQKAGMDSCQRVIEKFDVSRMGKEYLNLYEEMIGVGHHLVNLKPQMNVLPKASVLMSVYNGEKYLRDAIESILKQSFKNFEFIIIDDGSCDNSVNIIESYHDVRIKLIKNGQNLGLIESLNKGLLYAQGEYIVRMDCDDISLSDRLFKQIQFMDQNPNVGVCGSWIEIFGDQEAAVWKYPVKSAEAKCLLLFRSILAHPSVMLRRKILIDNNLKYSNEYPHAEDYGLWVELSRYTDIVNIAEVLLRYRISDEQVTKHHRKQQLASTLKVQLKQLNDLGIQPNKQELALHEAISLGQLISNIKSMEAIANWFLKLQKANTQSEYYPILEFTQVLRQYWLGVCQAIGPSMKENIEYLFKKYDFILSSESSRVK